VSVYTGNDFIEVSVIHPASSADTAQIVPNLHHASDNIFSDANREKTYKAAARCNQ
jgi:hypothetical protein